MVDEDGVLKVDEDEITRQFLPETRHVKDHDSDAGTLAYRCTEHYHRTYKPSRNVIHITNMLITHQSKASTQSLTESTRETRWVEAVSSINYIGVQPPIVAL